MIWSPIMSYLTFSVYIINWGPLDVYQQNLGTFLNSQNPGCRNKIDTIQSTTIKEDHITYFSLRKKK